MSTTLKDEMNALDPTRRAKVEGRAEQLIGEEMSLQQLRRAHKLTQVKVGKSLGIGQDSVARLERRSDVLISTLRHYVESMGGSLRLVAEFPNRKPVVLSGLADVDTTVPPKKPRGRTAARRPS
jgi:transcriptional regulator with XRE-family HTH domain